MKEIGKLARKDIQDILALTPLQEGLLYHYLKDSQSQQYFEQLNLEISGKINRELFQKAWNVVVQTNELLRTCFRWEKLDIYHVPPYEGLLSSLMMPIMSQKS